MFADWGAVTAQAFRSKMRKRDPKREGCTVEWPHIVLASVYQHFGSSGGTALSRRARCQFFPLRRSSGDQVLKDMYNGRVWKHREQTGISMTQAWLKKLAGSWMSMLYEAQQQHDRP